MRETLDVIEPDETLRRQLAGALEQAGLRAEPYEDARTFLLYRGSGCRAVLVADDREDAFGVIETLGQQGVWLPVIAYSSRLSVRRIVRFLRAGGYDYFVLPLDAAELTRSIAQLRQGKASYAVARQRAAAARVKLGWLSPREAEVLASMAEGRSNKSIGIDLGISPRTVEIHRANMLAKLGAHSSSEALRMFIEDALLNGEAASPDA
ncbi:response regulator transcription factor [Alteriqipengyuania lutimaris]|uniref:Helix-turn-helix transcriptional regulator n=1 Tax=Alteriqipengyuania lutimaris TaxID=1538146 RepID=A0A395LNQ4_9SPHN|nr:LuxR C-terminal-related transcriptional regulator [Alteriqipengyuania lutimaris]MBB3032525.1 FixJ family two-component response regulator [Alteriqipengyuania lutimaris]RDS78693.1 helix-turn-helix transcriptional regulator [Alteriqipengyuania lutimaris]